MVATTTSRAFCETSRSIALNTLSTGFIPAVPVFLFVYSHSKQHTRHAATRMPAKSRRASCAADWPTLVWTPLWEHPHHACLFMIFIFQRKNNMFLWLLMPCGQSGKPMRVRPVLALHSCSYFLWAFVLIWRRWPNEI